MKEIKRTRTIEEVTGYEAFDDTWFKTKEECEAYEKSARGVIRGTFLKGTLNKLRGYNFMEACPSCSDEEDVYAYKIESIEDVKLLGLINETNSEVVYSAKDIGKTAVIIRNYDNEFWVSRWTPEKYKREFCELMDKLCTPKSDKEVAKDETWDKYIEYLYSWIFEHSDAEFKGMSPVGYVEWLENENEEEEN